jgi:hypothetical protein
LQAVVEVEALIRELRQERGVLVAAVRVVLGEHQRQTGFQEHPIREEVQGALALLDRLVLLLKVVQVS